MASFKVIDVDFIVKDPPKPARPRNPIKSFTAEDQHRQQQEKHQQRNNDSSSPNKHVKNVVKSVKQEDQPLPQPQIFPLAHDRDVKLPKDMKRGVVLASKRSLAVPKPKNEEQLWNSSARCPDRDLLNLQLDNEISLHRKKEWPKTPREPEPVLLGTDKRAERVSHEKLISRSRIDAKTSGAILNYAKEKKEVFFPERSVIHSGRRSIAGSWNGQPLTFDVYDEERAKPQTKVSAMDRDALWAALSPRQAVPRDGGKLLILKPESSICR